ncbi:hypothetical protein [Flavobacterium sp. SM2513]|uniref:hypothetical protein n=1 Tax=Flavobacterium sp. SM2513 TaxID=3424766 RepID=UPI003D7FA0FF
MMTNVLFKITVLFILLVGNQTYAQFQNNSNSLNKYEDLSTQNRYNESKNRTPVDYAKVMTENLTDKLKLDGFQSAIVKNLIEDFLKKNNDIMLESIPRDAKVEKSNIAKKEMEYKFVEIFTDEQKVLFEEFTNQGTSKPKKKKKRKDTDE